MRRRRRRNKENPWTPADSTRTIPHNTFFYSLASLNLARGSYTPDFLHSDVVLCPIYRSGYMYLGVRVRVQGLKVELRYIIYDYVIVVSFALTPRQFFPAFI